MGSLSSLFRKERYALRGMNRIASRQSRLKVTVIASFVIVFEAGLFAAFSSGFFFLNSLGGVGMMIIPKLFALFFLGLGLMLVISSTLTSYAAMYRSTDMQFLMVRPYSISELVLYKFFRSAILSSWALFFIIIPFLAAYARHEKLGLSFALWTFLFSMPFVLLCSAVGTMATIVTVRWVPQKKTLKYIGVCVLFLIALAIRNTIGQTPESSDESMLAIGRLVPGLRYASSPMLPSFWMAEGILSLSAGNFIRGTMFWGVTTSTCMFLILSVEWTGNRLLYNGWQRSFAGSASKGRRPLLYRLNRLLGFLAHDIRAMVIKDIRTLLRDPMQWSQILIFFGLLGLYFVSLRSFHYDRLPEMWRTLIAFLNVFSVSTVICALASRFIYPQLSLEGQGFWILGLSPTTMKRILLTKFGLAVVGTSSVSILLMHISTEMLRVDPVIRAVAILLALAISLASSGMSTGLGAIFLDLKQRNPAAIVSGFGGTLNLVLGLGFMIATVLPFAAMFHLAQRGHLGVRWFGISIAVVSVWTLLLTAVAVTMPLWLGRRSLQDTEY